MITLYWNPGNASMAPHVVLHELGVPFELKRVDRSKGEHRQPAYLKLNPNGQIPALVDGELVLYESAALCLHLADTHAGAGLAPPPGSAERALLYQWLMWLTNTLQAMLMHYFYPERMVDDGDAAAAAQVRTHAETRIGGMLQILDDQLGRSGGPWLLGAAYSVADPFALMVCRWTRGFGRPARAYPHLGPYLQRMLARPAVRKMAAAEGLAEPLV